MRRQATVSFAAALLSCTVADRPLTDVEPRDDTPSAIESMALGIPQEGWIVGPNGMPTKISYVVVDGLAIREGDIVVGPPASIAASQGELRGLVQPSDSVRAQAVILDGSTYRWPGGVLPYTTSGLASNDPRIIAAIAHIESRIPAVQIVPRTTQADYVQITWDSTDCQSYVGRQGGQQTLWLADWCGSGNTTHELLHALGESHEQSRCDRNSYIAVHYFNIQSSCQANFDRHCSGWTDVAAYDATSIMHYARYLTSPCAIDPTQPVLSVLSGQTQGVGQRIEMKATDVAGIHRMYPMAVGIVGETFLTPGPSRYVTWSASGSNGYSPYSYSWFIDYGDDGMVGNNWQGASSLTPDSLKILVTECFGPVFGIKVQARDSNPYSQSVGTNEILVENWVMGPC